MNWFVLDGKKPPVQHKPALDQPGTYADFDAATAREEGSRRLGATVCRVHPPAVDLPTAIVVLRSKSRHLFAFMTITGSVHTTKQVVSQERRLDFIFNPIGVLTNGSTIQDFVDRRRRGRPQGYRHESSIAGSEQAFKGLAA